MKVYLSARYDRRLDLVPLRDELLAEGFGSTSTWLCGNLDHSTATAELEEADIRESDVVVAFSEEPVMYSDRPFAARGGRHVEVGMALALGIPVIVVGPAENIFHLLPEVTVVGSWFECKALLFEMAVPR